MPKLESRKPYPGLRVAVDTGGTFTDCIYRAAGEWRVLKVFSTRANPALAVLAAIDEIDLGMGAEIRHGTTIGTNALIERRGARTALVTTAGFEDAIAIGRQARQQLYDFLFTPLMPLADASLRFGIRERTGHDGTVLQAIDQSELDRLVESVKSANPESIAVSLLFSFANPANERSVVTALEGLGVPVSASHCILPEFREFERTSTVLVNAYLAPKMGSYLGELERHMQGSGSKLFVMQSSGGIVSAKTAARDLFARSFPVRQGVWLEPMQRRARQDSTGS